MNNTSKASMVGVLIIALLAITDYRFLYSPATYILLAAILLAGFMAHKTIAADPITKRVMAQMKKRGDGTIEMGEKEKEYLIFHIITTLDKKNALDMSELAGELNVSIYELNSVIKFLSKHEAVEVVFPPLKNFPILKKGDPEKSNSIKMHIFEKLAKKNILGEAKMEEFGREVLEYLDVMRRKKEGKE
jgi:hypothetical protein